MHTRGQIFSPSNPYLDATAPSTSICQTRLVGKRRNSPVAMMAPRKVQHLWAVPQCQQPEGQVLEGSGSPLARLLEAMAMQMERRPDKWPGKPRQLQGGQMLRCRVCQAREAWQALSVDLQATCTMAVTRLLKRLPATPRSPSSSSPREADLVASSPRLRARSRQREHLIYLRTSSPPHLDRRRSIISRTIRHRHLPWP